MPAEDEKEYSNAKEEEGDSDEVDKADEGGANDDYDVAPVDSTGAALRNKARRWAHSCHTVATLLSHCCHTLVTRLLHGCYTCYTLVTLLLQCSFTFVWRVAHAQPALKACSGGGCGDLQMVPAMLGGFSAR
jgi:hypothetical protein